MRSQNFPDILKNLMRPENPQQQQESEVYQNLKEPDQDVTVACLNASGRGQAISF